MASAQTLLTALQAKRGKAYYDEFNALMTQVIADYAGVADRFIATSTSTVTVGSGSKTFTLSATGKSMAVGSYVMAYKTSDPTTYVIGQVTAFSDPTLTISVGANDYAGSGSASAWTIILSAAPANLSSATVLATGSTTGRTLAARAADIINVRDFSASPSNSAPVNTTAVNAAIAAAVDGATLMFTGGNYLLNIGDLSFGAKKLRLLLDGATINSTFPLSVGAIVEGQFGKGQRVYQGAGAASDDFALHYSYRVADYTGGSGGAGGTVNAGILHKTVVGANASSNEWGIVGVIESAATSNGDNTAIYGQFRKTAAGARGGFAGVFEARDLSGDADPTSGLIGCEVDVFANGTDANGRRWGLCIVTGKGLPGGAKSEAAYGIWVGPTNEDTTQGRFKTAVGITGDIDRGVDVSAAQIVSGVAFRQAINQTVSFTAYDDRTIGYTSSGLDYKVAGTTVLRVRDDGALFVSGVSSGNTGVRVPNGARISLTSYDDRTLRYSSSGFDYDVSGTTKFRVTDTGAAQLFGQVTVNGQTIADSSGLIGLRSYTVATMPSAATAARLVYVADEAGGPQPAQSNGTNWRRWQDNAIVS